MTALLDIQSRQKLLIAQCAEQRADLARAWSGFQRPAAAGKQAINKLRSPWLWVGIGLIALKLPLRKVSRIPILLFKGWRMAQKVHAMIR